MLDFDSMPEFKLHAYKILTLIPVWAKAYEVDEKAIIKQIPIAYAWTKANPDKAPKKFIPRFLNNWMGNAKRFGNLIASPNKPLFQEKLADDNELLTYDDIQAMKGTR